MCTGPRSAWMAERPEGDSASSIARREPTGSGGDRARVRGRRLLRRGARLALAVERADEHLGHLRVELRAGVLAELADRLAVVHRLSVGAVGDHRVVGVAGQDDAGADRDLLALEPIGVAAAVEALVLAADDARDPAEPRDRAEDALADD